MAIFTSKTPTVEAWQWADFGDRAAGARWIVRVVEAEGGEARYEPQQEDPRTGLMTDAPRIAIRGIDGWDNGWAYANPGDYVVKGEAVFARDQFRAERENPVPAGGRVHDFYPCDPETFEKRWTRS